MKSSLWAMIGAWAAALAVALGAFGAHALKKRLGLEAQGWWGTATQYHFVHALGLFAVAWVATWSERTRLVAVAGGSMVAGLVLFSGSLYVMALTDQRWLGRVTPLGGTAWIVGWVCLGLAARR
jgi:uncharacterized membrane protein YgdD (TMEM256/DUF423 family)